MSWMFDGATSFNGDLSAWNTSRVTNMWSMFWGATLFNSDLSSWDISSVTDMEGMLAHATSFNQDLCAWGDKSFPYNNDSDLFFDSGCTYQDTPQEDKKGPFYASDCKGDMGSSFSWPKPPDYPPPGWSPAPKSSGAYKYVPIFTVTSWSLMSILSLLLGFYQ